jgi:hypothetical protein
MFNENKYVGVKEILPADIVDIVSRYALIDELTKFTAESTLSQDAAQVPEAHSKYADPLMESLLQYLQPAMEFVTGLTLYPTYSYYRVYRPGMDLKPHIDRPACEISTTVSFKYNYMGSDQESWPIWIKGRDGNKGFSLDPGDAVVYRGCEVEHWRDVFNAPEGSYHIQGFFHYVNANGPYADQQLDKRMFIGQPKENNVSATLQKSSKSYISTIY